MPDFPLSGALDDLRAKSAVLYPPVSIAPPVDRPKPYHEPLTFLWCHRWEHDKNPEPFFEALIRLDRDGRDFNLVLLGERFRTAPPVFQDSWDALRSHIRHAGFLPGRPAYLEMLSRCDIVISTAIQENFGMAVVEAIIAGCHPLLPARLAYPEVLPAAFHDRCLYDSDDDLYPALVDILNGPKRMDDGDRTRLQREVFERYSAGPTVAAIDDALEELHSVAGGLGG